MSIVDKYAAPNRLVSAPLATICRVFLDSGDSRLYIQLSPDENMPLWTPLGQFFEDTFEHFVDQEEFIQDCLKIYNYKELQTFLSFSKKLK